MDIGRATCSVFGEGRCGGWFDHAPFGRIDESRCCRTVRSGKGTVGKLTIGRFRAAESRADGLAGVIVPGVGLTTPGDYLMSVDCRAFLDRTEWMRARIPGGAAARGAT